MRNHNGVGEARCLRLLGVAAIACGGLFACSAQPPQETMDKNQAVKDFIEVRELEQTDKLRSHRSKGWDEITNRYIIYRGHRQDYLVAFSQPCWQLSDTSWIIADERSDPNYIRAKFETLRGCRIAEIYPLTSAEVAELENIGEPPGSRN